MNKTHSSLSPPLPRSPPERHGAFSGEGSIRETEKAETGKMEAEEGAEKSC